MVAEALAEAEDTFMDGTKIAVRDDLEDDEEGQEPARSPGKKNGEAAVASQSYDLTLGEGEN